jgi:4-nitrophenyl phosphatase
MAGLDPVVVVVGASAEAVVPSLGARPLQVVRNYRWAEGLSTSVNVGLSVLPTNTPAAVFLPIDQPLITVKLLRRYIDLWQASGAGIIAPQTPQGRRGTPVLFSRQHFKELANLSGDVGGRALIERYQDQVTHLPVNEAMILSDADTPAAFADLRAYAARQEPDLTFESVQGVICDMDGVLWRGQSPLPGLGEFFELIEQRNLAYVLATNNSSRTPEQYVQKLAAMDVMTGREHVLNSAIAAARHVADRSPGATVYAIGGPGVGQALTEAGLVPQMREDLEHADYVVVGWDQKLTWAKLATATRLILDGASFVGTNPDLTFPMEQALAPGNGAQTAALEAATGVAPAIVGKPASPLYQQAIERMGTTPETTLVIGDRLDTDILGGIRLGMPTVLLMTGVTHQDDLAHSPIRPTLILKDLPDLVRTWEQS